MNILSRQNHQKMLGELDLKIRDTDMQKKKQNILVFRLIGIILGESMWMQSRGRPPVPY